MNEDKIIADTLNNGYRSEYFESTVDKLACEIAQNKQKILDDFFKAYLAQTNASIQMPFDMRKIELVEQRGIRETTYYFRIKRGRPKKSCRK